MTPVADRHPSLSLADAIQLAGIVAVEAAGGPAITFAPGRRDSWAHVPEGRLFDPRGVADPAAALRAFADRLGMSTRHVVALAAVHSLARWWPGPPVVDAARRNRPPRFDNAFFRGVLSGAAQGDAWLLADPETRLLVQEYADNEAALVCDYAAAHEELARLGPRSRAPPPPPAPEVGIIAVAVAAGVAVAVVGGMALAVAAWRRRRQRRVL